VALLVSGNQQRPLVSVALLAPHEVPAQVVAGGPDVLEQPAVMLPIGLEGGPHVTELSGGPLARNGLLTVGAVDSVPEHIGIRHRGSALAGWTLERRLQIPPVDRRHDNQVLDDLRDVPGVRVWMEINLRGSQPGDFVREPGGGHLQVRDEMLPLGRAQRGRRESPDTDAADESDNWEPFE